jgi:hypothetical protein
LKSVLSNLQKNQEFENQRIIIDDPRMELLKKEKQLEELKNTQKIYQNHIIGMQTNSLN